MIFLGAFEEFSPGMGFPSMREYLQEEPYETKQAVLERLRAGNVHMTAPGVILDVISGENTYQPLLHMNDGEYTWTTRLIYYIDRYNLRLPMEVENGFLRKAAYDGTNVCAVRI